MPCDRLRAITLREDIGLRQQFAQLRPSLFAGELDESRELAAAGVDGEPGDRRQIGAIDQQHVGAMRRERAAGDGTCDHAREIEHADAGERALARGPGFGRRLADLLDREHRKLSERFGMRRRRPFFRRAHEGNHGAAGIGRGLERLAVPPRQRRLDLLALRLASQHLADGGAVMGEVGVQPHVARIARAVDAGGRVPCSAAAVCRRGASTAPSGIRRWRGAYRP